MEFALVTSCPSIFIFIPETALPEKKERRTAFRTFLASCLLSLKGTVSPIYPGGIWKEQVESAGAWRPVGQEERMVPSLTLARASCRPLSASVLVVWRTKRVLRSLPAPAVASKTKLVQK